MRLVGSKPGDDRTKMLWQNSGGQREEGRGSYLPGLIKSTGEFLFLGFVAHVPFRATLGFLLLAGAAFQFQV